MSGAAWLKDERGNGAMSCRAWRGIVGSWPFTLCEMRSPYGVQEAVCALINFEKIGSTLL